MRLKTKKGELAWDEIGKLLIFVVIFIVLLILIWIFKDKIYSLFEKIKVLLSGGFR